MSGHSKGEALLRTAAAEIERLGGVLEDITHRRKHYQVWWTCNGHKFVNTLPATPRGQYWDITVRTQIRRKLREVA